LAAGALPGFRQRGPAELVVGDVGELLQWALVAHGFEVARADGGRRVQPVRFQVDALMPGELGEAREIQLAGRLDILPRVGKQVWRDPAELGLALGVRHAELLTGGFQREALVGQRERQRA
jgi:hypothetical protein